jgi:hypothetical protein
MVVLPQTADISLFTLAVLWVQVLLPVLFFGNFFPLRKLYYNPYEN